MVTDTGLCESLFIWKVKIRWKVEMQCNTHYSLFYLYFSQADELSELFGERMPKRLTAARFLWSLKHESNKTEKCVSITTPAGYIAHKLTTTTGLPQLVLGVGEASGMFPVDSGDIGCNYRNDWLEAFDRHVCSKFPGVSVPSLRDLLPQIRTAGDTRNYGGDNSSHVVLDNSILDPGGWLHDVKDVFCGGKDDSSQGILLAPSEGDQPTALAASLIGQNGMISCSFGTSVVANMVGKASGASAAKKGKSLASVDRFNAVNGQPISMVWLRNGTTYLNRMVESYGGNFEGLLQQAVEAPSDCGGLLALPFLDDEPGLNVAQGGTGMIVGFNSTGNHKAGNVIKAAMISVMFNLYLGTQQVEQAEAAATTIDEATRDAKGLKKEIILTGGLTKTPETGQILANIFDRPVRLLEAADEGGAWGSALLAKYSDDCQKRQNERQSSEPPHPNDWLAFLSTIEAKEQQAFFPQPEKVEVYRSVLEKYTKLLKLQPQLDRVMNGP